MKYNIITKLIYLLFHTYHYKPPTKNENLGPSTSGLSRADITPCVPGQKPPCRPLAHYVRSDDPAPERADLFSDNTTLIRRGEPRPRAGEHTECTIREFTRLGTTPAAQPEGGS